MKQNSIIFTLAFMAIGCKAYATETKDSSAFAKHFELSFGQSLLFISSSRVANIRRNNAVVLPTSAILFLGEMRPEKRLRIPVFLNIATESKQFIIDGKLVNERAAPTFGTGVQFRMFRAIIEPKTSLELETGPLMSLLFNRNKEIKIAPIGACRFRLNRGENFTMYVGASYSFGINAFGLLFGTGTIF